MTKLRIVIIETMDGCRTIADMVEFENRGWNAQVFYEQIKYRVERSVKDMDPFWLAEIKVQSLEHDTELTWSTVQDTKRGKAALVWKRLKLGEPE